MSLNDRNFAFEQRRQRKADLSSLRHTPSPQMKAAPNAGGQDQTQQGKASEAWPEPDPLTRELPPADPYPLPVLGRILSDAACVLQEGIQAPDAICGQSLLAGAALATQGHADISIDGRVFPISENFISVAKTGERKTATDRVALSPHAKRQRELQQQYGEQSAEYEADLVAWRKARDEALSSKTYKTREEKKRAVLALGSEPEEPINAILMTEEPTYEGLVKAFAHGWPSVGLYSDEGGRFLGGHGMNQDNQLKTSAGLSKLWDGSPITRTRSGDGNLLLYGRRLSVHLMVQPEVSNLLFGNSLLTSQGLLSRCLVASPQSRIGHQPYKEMDVYQDPSLKQYFARISALLEAPLPLAKGTRNELSPRQLLLSPEAKQTWIQFHDHIQTLVRSDQPLASIQGLAAKAAEHAARLAGILALVEDPQVGEIEGTLIEAGIELVQFYLDEALRLFNAAAINPDLLLAEKLLSWARLRGGLIYLRAIYQYGPNAIRDKATARRILHLLENHGWVRSVPGGAEIDGAQRRDVWEVRP